MNIYVIREKVHRAGASDSSDNSIISNANAETAGMAARNGALKSDREFEHKVRSGHMGFSYISLPFPFPTFGSILDQILLWKVTEQEGQCKSRRFPTGASTTGNVSYDAFLGPTYNTPSDHYPYKIMVWLARLGGLAPIGSCGLERDKHSDDTERVQFRGDSVPEHG